ncbi:MAG: 30S ribosomal protein S20 [Tenericutes bacterium]|nr:30S ribosomal protein S20 [Mycoplasmatota bacterium]
MANIKSAKKRIVTSRKAAALNNDVKASMKTSIKKFEKSLNESVEVANDKLKVAIKNIDKAASKGVIKKNTASRYKSNLTKKLNAKNN